MKSPNIYKRCRFPSEIIQHAVWLYHRFNLSHRDIESGVKPYGVIGVSIGSLGTSMAQQHLRNILAYLDVPVLGQPEAFIQFNEDMFNADGSFGDNIKPFLQSWMNRYEDWVRTNTTTHD